MNADEWNRLSHADKILRNGVRVGERLDLMLPLLRQRARLEAELRHVNSLLQIHEEMLDDGIGCLDRTKEDAAAYWESKDDTEGGSTV